MSNFLEVLPGVCISTRRIVSVEAQEHKGVSGHVSGLVEVWR